MFMVAMFKINKLHLKVCLYVGVSYIFIPTKGASEYKSLGTTVLRHAQEYITALSLRKPRP